MADLTFSFVPKEPILKGGNINIRLPCFDQNSGSMICRSLIPKVPSTTLKVISVKNYF